MPKRKISSGAAPLQQLDCSDGAKMLIDQMKQHPEEFRPFAGKFTSILDMARETSQGLSRSVKMSHRDAAAIMAAAETHLYEVWLAEDVLTNMMKPKTNEKEEMYVKSSSKPIHGTIGNSFANHNLTASTSTAFSDPGAQMSRMVDEKINYVMEERARRERALKPNNFRGIW